MSTIVCTVDLFRRLLPHFSDDARVVRLDIPFTTISVKLDELVTSFTWPTPAEGSHVHVDEPDREGLVSRTSASGIDLDNETVFAGAAMIPEQEGEPTPGSTLPVFCVWCGEDELVVIDATKGRPLVESHAKQHGGRVTTIPSTGPDARLHLNGAPVLVAHCSACLQFTGAGDGFPKGSVRLEMACT